MARAQMFGFRYFHKKEEVRASRWNDLLFWLGTAHDD